MFTLNCKGRLLKIDRPLVMGIINTTPDSFYSGSRAAMEDEVVKKAEQMILEGADILDLGGQSTRPGSQMVDEKEEAERVIPAIKSILRKFPGVLISIDSFYASVVLKAADAGASIINDVSAGTIDSNLLPLVAKLQLPYVLMHMKGLPAAMQENPVYENVTLEVFDFLNTRLHALRTQGIKDIIIDPGFGFGKTISHNFRLLQELDYFRKLDCPLMAGLSRKATVYKTLQVTPEEALNGTTVLHTIALMKGASILRVHDVKEAMQCITLTEAIKKSS